MTDRASQRPWKISPMGHSVSDSIGNYDILDDGMQGRINLELSVYCVNVHDGLVKALTDVYKAGCDCSCGRDIAEKALKLAGEL